MKTVSRYKNIFVVSPCYITGGPEALHQMVYYLNSLGATATIVYASRNDMGLYKIPDPYQIYVNRFVCWKDIIDDPYSCVVLPETYWPLARKFKKATVFIWWLSVDNSLNDAFFRIKYFAKMFLRPADYRLEKKELGSRAVIQMHLTSHYCFKNEANNVRHLCASHYAYDYVTKRSKKGARLLIEPISKPFICEPPFLNICERKDVVLFNPAKSMSFVEKLKKTDPAISFVPLKGYSINELKEKYRSSKLYIDFGPFPGAERMPKEAAYNGCIIITGKHGASGYYNDVPIPDDYKFDEKEVGEAAVIDKIKMCLQDYRAHALNMSRYIETISQLEKRFVEGLQELFFESTIGFKDDEH